MNQQPTCINMSFVDDWWLYMRVVLPQHCCFFNSYIIVTKLIGHYFAWPQLAKEITFPDSRWWWRAAPPGHGKQKGLIPQVVGRPSATWWSAWWF